MMVLSRLFLDPSGILSKYTSTATEVGVASQSQQTARWLDWLKRSHGFLNLCTKLKRNIEVAA